MSQKDSKLNIEKTLGSMHLASLDEHVFENAKTRVWNHLNHSIVQSETVNPAPKSHKTKTGFWNKYNTMLFTFSSLVLAIAIALSVTTYLYAGKDNTSTVADNQNTTKTDSKKLAASRLEQLLGGVPYQEVESLVANDNRDAALSPTSAIAALPISTSKTYTEEAKKLYERNKDAESKVHYSEYLVNMNSEKSISAFQGNTIFGPVPQGNPKIDYTKTIKIQIWMSPSYSKYVVSQNDQIATFSLYTPEFAVNYLGGKYAIKANFDTAQYFSAYAGEDAGNPELQFLKSVLSSNSNIKEIGTKEIDGKNYIVYEMKSAADGGTAVPFINSGNVRDIASDTSAIANYTTKFYVEKENFQLEIVENYIADELLLSTKINASQDFMLDKNEKGPFVFSDLGNLEVKELAISTVVSTYTLSVSTFAKRYSAYYLANINEPITNPIDLKDQLNNPYEKLVNTKEFNPLYVESQKTEVRQIANYNQGQVFVLIYDKEPVSQTEDNEFVKYKKTNIKINLAKVETAAVFVEQSITKPIAIDKQEENTSGVTKPSISPALTISYILFKAPNGLYYQINESLPNPNTNVKYLKKEGFSLDLVTSEKALQMDAEVKARNDAIPSIKVTSLSKINMDMRLLPGDLSVGYGFKALNIYASTKPGSLSTCDKYGQTTNSIDCLVEKYDGFKISFGKIDQTSGGSSSSSSGGAIAPDAPVDSKYVPGSGSLEFVVLAATNAKAGSMLKAISDISGGTVFYKEISGKTVIFSGDISSTDANKIFAGVKVDNGYTELFNQLEKNQ
jgi:hypothetical protein